MWIGTMDPGIRVLVKKLLETARFYEWSLQGFGMLRLYLPQESGDSSYRLHVWHNKFAVPGVSEIHDHPWNFNSYVVAGKIRNRRYMIQDPEPVPGLDIKPVHPKKDYRMQTIRCGVGGGATGEPFDLQLQQWTDEDYGSGEFYHQDADEIHESIALPGTVTLVRRYLTKSKNPDLAHVFWPRDKEWVTAEPRAATMQEVMTITRHALDQWF